MSPVASQITSLTIAYSTVYSIADHSKYQTSSPMAFISGNHQWPVNSSHRGPVTRKMIPFDDVIMINASYRVCPMKDTRHLDNRIEDHQPFSTCHGLFVYIAVAWYFAQWTSYTYHKPRTWHRCILQYNTKPKKGFYTTYHGIWTWIVRCEWWQYCFPRQSVVCFTHFSEKQFSEWLQVVLGVVITTSFAK